MNNLYLLIRLAQRPAYTIPPNQRLQLPSIKEYLPESVDLSFINAYKESNG